MYTNIYKLADGQWHLWNIQTDNTECGQDMSKPVVQRVMGQRGNTWYPDPPKKEVCKRCFSFLTF
jgi:hypothetical protein